MTPEPLVSLPRLSARQGKLRPGERIVAEETAIAFLVNGCPHAVMMATPADLEDFALGFALAEGIVAAADDLLGAEIVNREQGIELRLRTTRKAAHAGGRQRGVTGSVGCGLCGVRSLAEALRPAPAVTGNLRLTPSAISAAMAALPEGQRLNQAAGSVHAAAFWTPERGLLALREDVGRHNALDKLAGNLARQGVDAGEGAVLLTSRISVEMVQKAARLGAPIVVAVSAPTALAIRTADASGITLVGIARGDAFEVFTHQERIEWLQGARTVPANGTVYCREGLSDGTSVQR